MKKLPLLLAFSLAANAAFLVTLLLRPEPAEKSAAPASGSKPAQSAVNSAGASAAGFSVAAAGDAPPTAQELAAIRVFRKLQAATKAMPAKTSPDQRYWQRSG